MVSKVLVKFLQTWEFLETIKLRTWKQDCEFDTKLGWEVVMSIAGEVCAIEIVAFFCNFVKRFICNNYIMKPTTLLAMNFATSPVWHEITSL